MVTWQMIGWDLQQVLFPIPMNQGLPLRSWRYYSLGDGGDSEELFGAGFSTAETARTTTSLSSLVTIHYPRNYNKNDFIVSSRRSDCFQILNSTVGFSSTTCTLPLTDDGNKKVTFTTDFTNTCSGSQFQPLMTELSILEIWTH